MHRSKCKHAWGGAEGADRGSAGLQAAPAPQMWNVGALRTWAFVVASATSGRWEEEGGRSALLRAGQGREDSPLSWGVYLQGLCVSVGNRCWVTGIMLIKQTLSVYVPLQRSIT